MCSRPPLEFVNVDLPSQAKSFNWHGVDLEKWHVVVNSRPLGEAVGVSQLIPIIG